MHYLIGIRCGGTHFHSNMQHDDYKSFSHLSISIGWMLVLGLYTVYVCPFDYTTFVVSGEVRIPLTCLTTPVEWLSLLKVTILSMSAIFL